ncbi:MAG: polysaccharide pyruvyl transferase [Bacteroidetes bacterium]|nr:MAG: polysaccharide pyruvyl transferase [Bacteroidota bacterium]
MNIGISGSYGGLNLGDEAILQSIIMKLEEDLDASIRVFSRNPEDTLERHRVDRAIDVRRLSVKEILPEIEELDLFILGGGGILYDSEINHYLREVKLARDRGIPVMLYGIGAGPLRKSSSQKLLRDSLGENTVITVRDRNSQKVLEGLGIETEIHVTADPALLLPSENLENEVPEIVHMDKKRKIVGFSVREPGGAAPGINEDVYHDILANAADYIIDRLDADILFIPMESNKRDQQHSHAVISLMQKPQHATVLKGKYTPGQLLSIMDRFSFAVGMRLHFLILAALKSIPLVGLPYSPKVEHFLEELGLVIPPMRLVNSGRLIAYIDSFWDKKAEIRRTIKKKIPELQARAGENHRILMDFIRSGFKSGGL